MPEHYQLFVNESRTIKVEIWPTHNSDGTLNFDFPETVNVATREDTADTWGPPINLVADEQAWYAKTFTVTVTAPAEKAAYEVVRFLKDGLEDSTKAAAESIEEELTPSDISIKVE